MNGLTPMQLEECAIPAGSEWASRDGGWHIAILRNGRAAWRGEGGWLPWTPGEALVLSPSLRGAVHGGAGGGCRIVRFRFCPDELTGVLTPVERLFLEKAALRPRMIPVKLPPHHPASQHFAALCAQERWMDGLAMRAALLRVAALCFDWRVPTSPMPKRKAFLPSNKRMQLLMGQITETELCEASPSDLASRCGCSVPHLKRLFNSHYGLSLQARQRELRLLRARELLVVSDLPIRDLAAAARCSRESQFISQFKRMFGLTPGEYRRQEARWAG